MLGNWIKQTTTTSGTGNITLASVTGFALFNDWFSTVRRFGYIVSDGNNWESGVGHLSSSTVLVRDVIVATYTSGTLVHGGTALSLSGASATVFCDASADDFRAPGWNGATTSTAGVQIKHHGNNFNSFTMTASYFMAFPIYLPVSGVYSSIRHHCGTAGGGTKFQWGVYQIDTSGSPAQLLARTADITPGTGDVSTSFTANVYLREGWYYLGWSGDGVPAFTAGNIYGVHDYGPVGVSSTGAPNNYCYVAGLSSPIADPAPGSLTFGQAGSPYVPIVSFIKV